MRISDWSSDVCSSDLPACLIKFLPGVSVTHPTPAQARAAGAALAQLHRSLADFTLERHNGLGPDEWPRLMRRCGDDLRSEEHTSELQSLMRISYAVFCLKKKNKQYRLPTTNDTTHKNKHVSNNS